MVMSIVKLLRAFSQNRRALSQNRRALSQNRSGLRQYEKVLSQRGKAFSVALLPVLVLYCGAVIAISDERLWLPESYKILHLKLVKAALQAENTDRCESVVSGTVHQGRSSLQHPVFKITCRDNRRNTYPILIDGITFQDLTPPGRRAKRRTQDELDQILYHKYWSACQKELNKRTKLMMELEWLTSEMPEPEKVSENETRFSVDFNAMDLQRRLLQYRARCTFTLLESEEDIQSLEDEEPIFELEATIGPRKSP